MVVAGILGIILTAFVCSYVDVQPVKAVKGSVDSGIVEVINIKK